MEKANFKSAVVRQYMLDIIRFRTVKFTNRDTRTRHNTVQYGLFMLHIMEKSNFLQCRQSETNF